MLTRFGSSAVWPKTGRGRAESGFAYNEVRLAGDCAVIFALSRASMALWCTKLGRLEMRSGTWNAHVDRPPTAGGPAP